jgi:hypothetical protein
MCLQRNQSRSVPEAGRSSGFSLTKKPLFAV